MQSGSFSSEETPGNGSPVTRGTTISVSIMRKNPSIKPEVTKNGQDVTRNGPKVITKSPTLLSESSEEPSSPQKLLDPQTMLPRTNKNQFIVAATIHKVDA